MPPRSKGSLKGSFCPRPGFQRTVEGKSIGAGFRRVISARNSVKNSVKLCAERAPKTSPDSDLSYRKQTYSRPYTCPVNRRVVGSSPTSGAINTVKISVCRGRPRGGPSSLFWWLLAFRTLKNTSGRPFLGRGGGRVERAGSEHKPGTCGPLYAALGVSTPDSTGHPGVLHQRWICADHGSNHRETGRRAGGPAVDLIGYDFMIDQRLGDQFKDGILRFGEKEGFRSFFLLRVVRGTGGLCRRHVGRCLGLIGQQKVLRCVSPPMGMLADCTLVIKRLLMARLRITHVNQRTEQYGACPKCF